MHYIIHPDPQLADVGKMPLKSRELCQFYITWVFGSLQYTFKSVLVMLQFMMTNSISKGGQVRQMWGCLRFWVQEAGARGG